MPCTHLFVINPKAGLGNRAGALDAGILKAMAGRDEPFMIEWTTHETGAADIVKRRLSHGGAWRIYACGGDGTLNSVVNAAYGYLDAAVTHIPCGTGNDFVKTFGEYAKRFQDLAQLLDGEEVLLDVMRINDSYAVNICSIGFDAEVAAQVHRFKGFRRLGSQTPYNLGVLYCVLRGTHRHYEVRIDGRRFEGRFTMLVAANGRFYGGGYHVMPEAQPWDGYLDFMMVKRVPLWKLLPLATAYAKGRYKEMPEVITHLRGVRMTVACPEEGYINVDGETLRSRTADISLCPAKIRFIVPKGASAGFHV